MSSRQWYIQYNDSILGPFTSNQLRRMAERSQITPNVKVRIGETGNWSLASSVKGLFSNGAATSDSMSSELSSEDIQSPTDSNDSSSSSEMSVKNSDAPPSEQTPASSSSFGEMRSEAPPIPGEIPVRGPIPPHGEIPIRGDIPPQFSQIGEMPSPPPPIEGDGLGWSLASIRHLDKKMRPSNAIPNVIQSILGSDEQVLYSAHPGFTVFLLQGALLIAGYLIFGLILSFGMVVNRAAGPGYFYLFLATIALIVSLAVHYIRWIRSSYIITNYRTFVKTGINTIEISYIYNESIQMIKIKTGIIDRILHLNTIELRTASGRLILRWVPLASVMQFYQR